MFRFSLSARLGLGFGIVILLLLVVGTVALRQMQVLTDLNAMTYRHPFAVSNSVRSIETDIEKIHNALTNAALDKSSTARDKAQAQIDALNRSIFHNFSIIQDRFLGDKEMLAKTEHLLQQWAPFQLSILQQLRAQRTTPDSTPLWAAEKAHAAQILAALAELSDFAQGKAREFQDGAEKTTQTAFAIMYVTIALAILCGVAFTMQVTRSVVTPSRQIAEVSNAIANGDLSQRITFKSNDEIGHMADSLRRMLTGVVGEGQSMLNSIPVHFWTADVNQTITFINTEAFDAISDVCECSRNDISGRLKISEVMRDEGRQTRQLVEQCLDLKTRVEGLIRFAGNNSPRNLQLIVSPLFDVHGEISGIMGIGLDITERVKAEAMLRSARNAADAASLSKSSFLANMSHEIRTPLNGIQGMLQLLNTSQLTPDQREYMEAALVSGRNLLSVIDDILDISKLEAGRMELINSVFSMNSLVSTIRSTFAFQVRTKGLRLTFDIAPDVPKRLWGDEGRIRQVLFNLVGNAVKFTDSGEVHIGIMVREHLPKGILLDIFVTDTGIGIPAEMHKVIFDEFTQVDNSASRKYQGTGLGLSIIRRLTALMEGEVNFHSEYGQGTTVRIKLPLALPSPEQELLVEEPLPAQKSDRPMHLLLAEDDQINQMAVSRMLEQNGHTIRIAENGRQVLAALDQENFDCILMDIQMPEMDGLEATRRIREKYGHKPPIIALTAHAMKGDREMCIQAGANDYVTKPVDIDTLLETLAKTLN